MKTTLQCSSRFSLRSLCVHAVRLLPALVFPLVLLSQSASADGEQVERSAAASADGVVEINVVRGELRVEGWDRNEINVTGTLDEETKEFIFDVGEGSSTIAVSLKGNTQSWCCEEGADLLIRVPRNSQVDISSVSTQLSLKNLAGGIDIGGVSGDISMQGMTGRLNVTTVSGEIELEDAEGEIRLRSVSGDLSLTDVAGDVTLRTISGESQVRNSRGRFDVETVSGDVDMASTRLQDMRGNTVSGDVDLDIRFDDGEALEVSSVSGSIRLQFDGAVDARFRLDARSGSIRNRLTDIAPQQSKYGGAESLVMVVGEGMREVRLQTRSGDILLR